MIGRPSMRRSIACMAPRLTRTRVRTACRWGAARSVAACAAAEHNIEILHNLRRLQAASANGFVPSQTPPRRRGPKADALESPPPRRPLLASPRCCPPRLHSLCMPFTQAAMRPLRRGAVRLGRIDELRSLRDCAARRRPRRSSSAPRARGLCGSWFAKPRRPPQQMQRRSLAPMQQPIARLRRGSMSALPVRRLLRRLPIDYRPSSRRGSSPVPHAVAAGACVAAAMNGAHLLRVHNIGLVRDAVLTADAIKYSRL